MSLNSSLVHPEEPQKSEPLNAIHSINNLWVSPSRDCGERERFGRLKSLARELLEASDYWELQPIVYKHHSRRNLPPMLYVRNPTFHLPCLLVSRGDIMLSLFQRSRVVVTSSFTIPVPIKAFEHSTRFIMSTSLYHNSNPDSSAAYNSFFQKYL
jgi:hypothetical protein